MSTSAADYLVDRRRLRRQLGFWRIVAFIVAALAIVAVGARFSGAAGFIGGPHIARLTVSGFIAGNDETLKLIREAREFAGGRRGVGPHRQPRRRHRRLRRNLRRIAPVGGEEAGGGGRRRHGRLRRLYRRARRRSHFRPRQFDRRLDRRAGRISQRVGADGQGRGQARVDQVVAAESGAERLRADQRRSARRDGGADRQFLRLVQGAGQRPARP